MMMTGGEDEMIKMTTVEGIKVLIDADFLVMRSSTFSLGCSNRRNL